MGVVRNPPDALRLSGLRLRCGGVRERAEFAVARIRPKAASGVGNAWESCGIPRMRCACPGYAYDAVATVSGRDA